MPLLLLDDSALTVIINGYVMPSVVMTTLITNCFVCVVLLRKELRSPTNLILVALAVSDTLTGIMPTPFFVYFYSMGRYVHGVPYSFCAAYLCFSEYLPTMTHTASIWLTVALAAHRYVCVCRTPARVTSSMTSAQHAGTLRRTVYVIVCIYVAAIAAHLNRFFELIFSPIKVALLSPMATTPITRSAVMTNLSAAVKSISFSGADFAAAVSGVGMTNYNADLAAQYIDVIDSIHDVIDITQREPMTSYVDACVFTHTPFIQRHANVYFNIYYGLRIVFIHVIPCTALVILNGLLVRVMRAAARRRNQLRLENRGCAERRRLSESNSTTLMLTVVVAVMLCVELPLAVLLPITLWENTFRVMIMSMEATRLVNVLVNTFLVFSYPINFFIYCAMSRQFRCTFMNLFVRELNRRGAELCANGNGTTEEEDGRVVVTGRTSMPVTRDVQSTSPLQRIELKTKRRRLDDEYDV